MIFDREFREPTSIYRAKPFWFWNGKITKEEITYQLIEMSQKGLGGAFICARQGLEIPYLSDQWFDLVKYACKEAKKLGLEIWLYDEYPYPSGMSGGEVLLEHPEAKHLKLQHFCFFLAGGEKICENLGWGRIIFAKAYQVNEKGEKNFGKALDIMDAIGSSQIEKIYQETGLTTYNHKRFFSYRPQHILETKLPEGNWCIEIYTEEAYEDFKYYGGFFDPCNKEAVKTFIDTTHERYKKELGNEFGKTICGIFSDETGMLSPIPWSKQLPEAFESRNGYPLISHMAAIFDNSAPNAYKVRYDLFETIHELLTENYHKQIANWCEKYDLLYVTEVPSFRMGTQKYSDIVGGDTAHEKVGVPLETIYDKYLKKYRANAKAISSLARQLDKKYAMVESFHSVGWTMTLQDAKWMIDRLGSSGINFNVFHAFFYTISDITKHDAPPSQFLQNPYWKYYRKLADYVGRMNTIISNTESDVSIAVLDPVASMWSKLGNPMASFSYKGTSPYEEKELNQNRDEWVELCKQLLFHQINYDHLDAEILKESKIVDGKLKIGRANYKIVILPTCHCMEKCVREKLEQFIIQGGIVISTGKLPSHTVDEGENDKETQLRWQEIFHHETAYQISDVQNNLITFCHKLLPQFVKVDILCGNGKEIITCGRFDNDKNYYMFFCNQGKLPVQILATVNGSVNRTVEMLLLQNGQRTNIPINQGKLLVSLDSYESQWYCFKKEKESCRRTENLSKKQIVKIPMQGEWNVHIEGNNVLRLSCFEMSFNQKKWMSVEAKTFIEQCADTHLLDGNQMSYTGQFGTPKKILPAYPLKVWYKTTFKVEDMPHKIELMMDEGTISGEYKIFINSEELNHKDWKKQRIIDQNNQVIDIKNKVKVGENQLLILAVVKKDEDGLRDAIFVQGDFGVQSENRLVKIPDKAEPDANWYAGFPYYSGTLRFEKTFLREELFQNNEQDSIIQLVFQTPHFDCIGVSIEGKNLGVKAFTPYKWQVNHSLISTREMIKVSVEITNSLSNRVEGTYFDYNLNSVMPIRC